MLKKYISKFVMDVFPSVVATIIGAYIVNHYINAKPASEPAVTAAAPATDGAADAKKAETKAAKSEAAKIEAAKIEIRGAETPSDLAGAPDSALARKAPDKAAERPSETASLPVETRRHQPAIHDKSVAKTTTPAVAAVSAVAPEPSQEERRDANDLARAAIERLRGSAEASRPSEQFRPAPAVPPLPPAITVASPPGESFNPSTTGSFRPPYAPAAPLDDPQRPTPPADIPGSRPMELHVEAAAAVPEHKTVAEDVLSAAKSVFHAVLPH
jgi:hypothetical protein